MRVDGDDLMSLKGADLRRWQRDCAMIFQQFNLVPRLDVLTNVMLGALNRRSTLLSLLNIFSREERLTAIARSSASASSRRRCRLPARSRAASSSAWQLPVH